MKLTRTQRIGLLLFAVYAAVAIFGPFVLTTSPHAIDGDRLMAPSSQHWLGTNTIGQDLFAQLVYGARTTLIIGLAVALISTFLSTTLGLLAGYSKRLDPLLNGLANMLLVLPSLLLILIVASFTGGGTWQLILTLGLLTWPGYMRLIRASVLSLKERDFVRAAQLYKAKSGYVLRRHLLPFIWPLVRTKFVVSFQSAVAMEASLSFLGIGDPSTISWGRMLQDAFSRTQTLLTDAWLWMVLPAAAAILVVIVSLAMISESSPSVQRYTAKLNRKPSRLVPRKRDHLEKEGSSNIQVPAITVRDMTVTYGDQTIIHPISFEVKAGSITSVVGESGSGKTTMARAVYGLLPDESVKGTVLINGHSIYAKDQADAMQRWVDAAYIFQDPRSCFNPIMTIGQQFYETMKLQHSKAEKRAAAISALKEVQLGEEVLSLYPYQLSGGMLARALIALALVNKPKVLIADEPTGALDTLVKREVFDLLVSKVREHRMALLLITHDIPAAKHISDHIIVLHAGRQLEPQPA